MKIYLDLVDRVLTDGERRTDRTGVGTLSLFGEQLRYDLREGFPLLTTKRVAFSAVVRELLWFLRGATNVNDGLAEHTSIWNPWAGDGGDVGPIYGYQWRRWGERECSSCETVVWVPFGCVRIPTDCDRCGGTGRIGGRDQLAEAIRLIKERPDSRRIVVSAWNVTDIDRMALPPCHVLFQFYVASGTWLDCQMYQRSADVALGVPFNIASYALLLTMVAQECGLKPRYLIHAFGDVHAYSNHVPGLKEQLSRVPHPLPRIRVARKTIDEIRFEDVQLVDYVCHPRIKFEVAV